MKKNYAYGNNNWKKNQWRPKLTVLNMEDIELETLYTFTMNKRSRIGILKKDIRDYLIHFKTISPYVQYYMVPEISPKGRLHYHGTIRFTAHRDIFSFYYNILPVLAEDCSIEIDTIKDINEWNKYIIKQQRYSFIYHEELMPYACHNDESLMKMNKDAQK